jgi:hypothetical protein
VAAKPKKKIRILVIGDWIVDDYWVIGDINSKDHAGIGRRFYRSLHDPASGVRALMGVGAVARFLNNALLKVNGPDPKWHDIIGLGLWHPEDQMLSHMFKNEFMYGRNPYMVSTMIPKGKPPRNVQLFNMYNLMDVNKITPITTEERPNRKTSKYIFGTNRAFRYFQILDKRKAMQLSRINWELCGSRFSPGRHWLCESTIDTRQDDYIAKWIKASKSMIDDIDYVIVKDCGKGVVSKMLIEGICKHLRSTLRANTKWHVSSRTWEPEWLSYLAGRVNIQSICFPDIMERNANAPHTWMQEGLSKDDYKKSMTASRSALIYLHDIAKKYAVHNSSIVVAKMLKDDHFIMLDYRNQSKRNHSSTVISGADSDLTSSTFEIGRTSALQSSIVLSDILNDSSISEMGGRALAVIRRQIKANTNWITEIGKPLVEPVFPEQAVQTDDLLQSYSTTKLLRDWKTALSDIPIFKHEKRHDDGSIGTIQMWRAATVIKDYVCIEPTRCKSIAALRDLVDNYDHLQSRKSRACLILAKPGSGKSTLLKRLDESLPNVELLSFNITTMNRREELIDCFDQIVTYQLNNPGQKLVVFFDEINAHMENHTVYDMFLAPLEDGYYMRGGKRFIIRPCIWLFAGTKIDSSDNKASDFKSRLVAEIDLVNADDGLSKPRTRRDKINLAIKTRYLRAENVYLALASLKGTYRDLNRVKMNLVRAFSRFRIGVSVRDVRRFVEMAVICNDGIAELRDYKNVYIDYSDYFDHVVSYSADNDIDSATDDDLIQVI